MVAKASKKDTSPTGKTPKKEASSSRTFRKSPARTEKPKSPSRAAVKTPPASPTRRSPSRRSPGRKSPARKSPSRKSPSRKSPSRRSPGRPPKSVETDVERRKVGRPSRRQVEADSDSDTDANRAVNSEKPKAAVRGRARKLDADFTLPKVMLQDIHAVNDVTHVDRDISSYVSLVRRSVQRSQPREVERIVHLKSNDAPAQKLTEFSDEDDVLPIRSSFVREKSERYSEPKVVEERTVKLEFGGWIGALLLIATVPFMIISLLVLCNETQCSLTKLPNFEKYTYFSTYIDLTSMAVYSCYLLLITGLSALPFGGPKVSGLPNKQGKFNYVMNGLFIALVVGLLLVGLELYNVPVISYIHKRHFQIIMGSIILAYLFSIYLYVHSFYVPVSALNPCAVVGNSRIYSFWMGRELNPRIFGRIDVKLYYNRICMVGMALLNAIYIYKSVAYTPPLDLESGFDFTSLKFNPTLLVIAALQIFYSLNYLVFEYIHVTTFEAQYEGAGFLTSICMFPSPFVLSTITKYVYDHGIRLPAWQLAVAAVMFSIGYIVFRGSNSQKHAFRQNPYNPALSHLESIPTSQGKKLLVSGYWGVVRHPNYAGDILMLLSFALFALSAPPVFICLGDIAFLIHRAQRDGTLCKQRYGTAWDRYCQRVKYILIPKVY